MQRQFTQFVELPSRENYLAACRAVLRETPLPLTATDLAELVRLLDAGNSQEVLDRIDLLPPSKALSPRVHFLAAEAAESLGDFETGEVERFLFVLCLQGLLSTGDGTLAAPYIVCHATDEYDILEATQCEPARQSLVEHEGRMLDVITCSDGREFWFDVTLPLRAPARRAKPAARGKAKPVRRRRISRLPR
jgi:hypothetical protein